MLIDNCYTGSAPVSRETSHRPYGALSRLRRLKDDGLLFLRFLAVGGLNTVFGYACYAGFVLLGAPLWLAVGGSTLVAVFFNFFSYGGLVFQRTSPVFLPRFLAFYVAISIANFAMLRVLTSLGIGPLLAQALLLPLLATSGFVVMRTFVFRGKPRDRKASMDPSVPPSGQS